MFARILKREGDDYFLVTPVEKWRVTVEDAPLYVVALEKQNREDQQALLLSTKTGDKVLAGVDHPLRVEINPLSGEPSPYILVRNGLEALISRPVYYELANLAEPVLVDGVEVYGVSSMGVFFPLT